MSATLPIRTLTGTEYECHDTQVQSLFSLADLVTSTGRNWWEALYWYDSGRYEYECIMAGAGRRANPPEMSAKVLRSNNIASSATFFRVTNESEMNLRRQSHVFHGTLSVASVVPQAIPTG
jgi:hypothetical protein